MITFLRLHGLCARMCDMDLKTHCTDLPPKLDALLSGEPCRNCLCCSAASTSVLLPRGGGAGHALEEAARGSRLVLSAGQRTTLMGSHHSRAPRGSAEAAIGPVSQPESSLPSSALFPFLPRVLTLRTVLKKCPAQ